MTMNSLQECLVSFFHFHFYDDCNNHTMWNMHKAMAYLSGTGFVLPTQTISVWDRYRDLVDPNSPMAHDWILVRSNAYDHVVAYFSDDANTFTSDGRVGKLRYANWFSQFLPQGQLTNLGARLRRELNSPIRFVNI
uniref:Orf135 n=1 Tax=Monoblepharella sp. JEL15 TaxID=224130 RepID=Q85MC7_9FUNG|nr:orf135 [Monoblepharella sp. JEL15]AAO64955.1 orf135 [Monoblepharella sp. JEL15]